MIRALAVAATVVLLGGCGCGEPEAAATPVRTPRPQEPRTYTAYDPTKPETACAFANWKVLFDAREGWVATGWVSNRDRDRTVRSKLIVVVYDERNAEVGRRELPEVALPPQGEQFFRAALLLPEGGPVPVRAEPVRHGFNFAAAAAGGARNGGR